MAKDIIKQLEKIQAENNELKQYKKDVEKALKKLGDFLPEKVVEKDLDEAAKNELEFAHKVIKFYALKNTQDLDKWCNVMLNPNSKKYWDDHRNINKTEIKPQTSMGAPF